MHVRAQQNLPGLPLPRSGWPNRTNHHCNVPKAGMYSMQLELTPHRAQYYLVYIAHICSPMPPSKCPGCQQLFEDPRGFANHKRQCCQIKVATARHLKQLQARNDEANRNLTQASQAGGGSSRVEEGQGGPAGIRVDGIHLVRLDLLLTLD